MQCNAIKINYTQNLNHQQKQQRCMLFARYWVIANKPVCWCHGLEVHDSSCTYLSTDVCESPKSVCTRGTPLKISNGLSALAHDPHSSQSPINVDKRTSLSLLPHISSDFSRKQQWDKWKRGIHWATAGQWWALEADFDC